MTDTPHRATPEPPLPEPTVWSAIYTLVDRLDIAEQRITELEGNRQASLDNTENMN